MHDLFRSVLFAIEVICKTVLDQRGFWIQILLMKVQFGVRHPSAPYTVKHRSPYTTLPPFLNAVGLSTKSANRGSPGHRFSMSVTCPSVVVIAVVVVVV